MKQYNKVAVLREDGYKVEHFDEVVYSFLNERIWCGITFPPLTPRQGLPQRTTPLAHLEDDIRVEEYKKLGLTPEGELIKEEKEKSKGLQFKITKIKKKKRIEKETDGVDLEEENRIRAALGIPLLK